MQNHVTVIPQDKTIIVDGQGLRFDFAAPAALRALQWRNGAGHIEYNDGSPNRPLLNLSYSTRGTSTWMSMRSSSGPEILLR